jgi:hypothetical protein
MGVAGGEVAIATVSLVHEYLPQGTRLSSLLKL